MRVEAAKQRLCEQKATEETEETARNGPREYRRVS